ncbi:MAG: outer membrane lipoprotein chaperone LolA [Gammaproteobacteria bacterium]|nr:outer membrane lipoprotein chaperone LolA [Gammaproteobacteria bacterium]MCW5582808.1 outer membrane lipoprotein chaperone LolA [Gammaproteobacteria bacterium]
MKLSLIQYLTALIICIFITAAHAVPASADLSKLLNAVNSMQAGFVQTAYDYHGKATQKSYGRMAMQRPGKFRWDVTKPIPQLIIANQTKLFIYDADLEQLTIRSLNKTAGETPALLLSHDNKTLETNFIVKSTQKNDPSWRWFVLTPKKPDNMFESIQIGFAGNQIREMHLQDNLGNVTVIQFQNIKQNINLSSSLFTFKPSSRVDIIDETRKK